MATELASKTITTPDPESVVTPVVQRSRWGRYFDALMLGAAFVLALLDSIGTFNFTSLGFTSTQAAWIGFGIFVVRFALTYRPIKVVAVKVEPPEVR